MGADVHSAGAAVALAQAVLHIVQVDEGRAAAVGAEHLVHCQLLLHARKQQLQAKGQQSR